LLKFALGNLRTIKLLSDFDSLLVYGLGPVYASLADVPFVAIPYGGDIMIVPFQDHYLSRMQRVAYSRAREILVGDPDFVNSLVRLSLSDRWKYFPFPVDIEKYAPMDMKSKDFVTERLPAWVGRKHIFFMPSRQDFFWKGTQKALRAFSRLAHQRDDVALVTPSWGVNTGDAIQIVHESGIDGSVVFLPYALSKPLLIEFYRAAYVVLDQFVLGSYGTAMLEAMACGRAVITHVERNKYERFLEHPPPNLQAFSEQEILQQMQWVLENPGAHEAICKQSRDWVVAEHTTKPLDLLQNVIFRHC
jgi:glycosyltransferase involved in cell wall biosynthesis